jgi:DNA-binding CsgD family transcriptional regulator
LGNESLAVLIQAIRGSSSHGSGTVSTRHYSLTPREIEIVQKIADGRSNKEVGHDFSIRERTVKHHLTNIFGKVGVSSRLELALFARDHQISTFPASSVYPTVPAHEDDWLRAEKQQTDEHRDPSRPELPPELKKRVKSA